MLQGSKTQLGLLSAATLLLMAGCGQSKENSRPEILGALASQGVSVVREFSAGNEVRGFAATVNDQPIAIYVTKDGNAIVGTRVDAQGKPIDERAITEATAKSISPEQWASLESSKWVPDGKNDAPRVVYVFTDPNCPYCHKFWEASQPWVQAGKVQVRYVIVGVIRPDSANKAASILDAKNPTAAFLLNEHRFEKGGIEAMPTIPSGIQSALQANERLMVDFGFNGTPGIVSKGPDGSIQTINGMPPKSSLGDVLGPL